MRLFTSSVVLLFLSCLISSTVFSQEIKFETADGKYSIFGRVAYFVLDSKPIENPSGDEEGLAVVIIRPDGTATKPVPVSRLSATTKKLLFQATDAEKSGVIESPVPKSVGNLPPISYGAEPAEKNSDQTVSVLQVLDSSPSLLVSGWSRDGGGFYKADKNSNSKWITIPLANFERIPEYKAHISLHNTGRRTGKPVFLVHLPVDGGGLFEMRFYYGATLNFSVQPTDSIEFKEGTLSLSAGSLANGVNDVEVLVSKERVSFKINGQSIGEFETPKTKKGAELSPPVVKICAIAGSLMEYRLHRFDISPSRQ